MDLSPFNRIVSLAFLWAWIILFFPWFDAFCAKHRLTPTALNRASHNHGTNRTYKEVSSFSLLFVFLNQIGDIKMSWYKFWLDERLWHIWEALKFSFIWPVWRWRLLSCRWLLSNLLWLVIITSKHLVKNLRSWSNISWLWYFFLFDNYRSLNCLNSRWSLI